MGPLMKAAASPRSGKPLATSVSAVTVGLVVVLPDRVSRTTVPWSTVAVPLPVIPHQRVGHDHRRGRPRVTVVFPARQDPALGVRTVAWRFSVLYCPLAEPPVCCPLSPSGAWAPDPQAARRAPGTTARAMLTSVIRPYRPPGHRPRVSVSLLSPTLVAQQSRVRYT
jgi:hypothetical protein